MLGLSESANYLCEKCLKAPDRQLSQRRNIVVVLKFYIVNLVSIRFITESVERLADFYEEVTGMKVIQYTPDFFELKNKTSTLAIGSANTIQFFGGNEVANAQSNKSSIIEFLAENVDHDYDWLAHFLKDSVVQKPTVMSWEISLFYFVILMEILSIFYTEQRRCNK